MQLASFLSTHMPLLAWLSSPSLVSHDSARFVQVVEGQVPADVGFPTAADWGAEDIGLFAVAVLDGKQLAGDTQLRPGKAALVLVVPFGSAKQVVLAFVQPRVDLPFESSKDFAETVVGFGSA